MCEAGYSNPWVCTQCGVCIALCPTDALTAEADERGYRYPMIDGERCVSCGLFTEVCPGPRLMHLEEHSRPTESDSVYGPLDSYGVGWSSDDELRQSSSSGGLVTAVLTSLLEEGAIKGAVVTDLGAENCTPRTRLVRTPEEITGARGSKYMITSMAEGLRDVVAADDGPFAVVGMPCQMHAVQRATDGLPALRRRIALRIALFCGATKDYRYRSLVAQKMGLDESMLSQFSFRDGGWPGEITGEDHLGRIGKLPGYDHEMGRIWTNALLTPPRCLVCDDPLGGAADLAVGDPWRIERVQDDLGKSLFLARTAAGASAVSQAVACGTLHIDRSIRHHEIMRSAGSLLWRRYYAPSRIKLVSLLAGGWRAAARDLPLPTLGLTGRACRAFLLSRKSWGFG